MLVGIVMMVLIFFSLLMSLSAIQTFLAHKASNYLHSHYGINIQLQRLQWHPSGKIVLDNLLVRDHQNDTLFYVQRMQTFWHKISDIKNNRIHLGKSELKGARLYITQYAGDTTDNLSRWVNLIDSLTTSSGAQNPFEMQVKSIRLNDLCFRIKNLNVKQEPLFAVKQLHGKITAFEIHGKKVEATLHNINYIDNFGLHVKQLNLRFGYSPQQMLFSDLHWATEHSQMKGNIQLHYSREQLRHFFDQVEWSGNLHAQISGSDINQLFDKPYFSPHGRFYLQIDSLQGVLNEWEWNHIQLTAKNNLNYSGDLIIFNLTKPDSLGIQLLADSLHVSYAQLEKLMPKTIHRYVPDFLRNAGNIKAQGNLVYFPGRIEINMAILTKVGLLQPYLFVHSNPQKTYRGTLRIGNLNLGKLFGINDLGKVSASLQIDGQGFDKQTASAQLLGKIQSLEYRDYAYRNLQVSGFLRKGKFDGKVLVNDPNFKMHFQGLIQFEPRYNQFNFTAHLDSADLYRTHWVRSDTLSMLSGTAQMQFRGKSVDDIQGTWNFENIHYVNSYNRYHLGFLHIHASDSTGIRRISLHSDKAVNGYLEGNFMLKHFGALIRYGLSTLFPQFKPREPLNDRVRFNLTFDSNLLELMDPRLEQVRNTRLKGKIDANDNYVHVDMEAGFLHYGPAIIMGTRMVLDNQNAIYNLFVRSDSIRVGNYPIHNFRAIHLNINDTVFVKSKFYGGPASRDTFDLAMFYVIDTSRAWTAGFLPSSIRFNHRIWEIGSTNNNENLYYFPHKDSLFIRPVYLTSDPAYIKIYGYNTPNKRHINLDVQNLNLQDLQELIHPATWAGTLNGSILLGKNQVSEFYNGTFSVVGFRFNDVPLGMLYGNFKTLRDRLMFVNLYNRFDNDENIRATGFLDFDAYETDINTRINSLPTNILSPFLQELFDHIRGNISGHLQITGKLQNPQYNGRLNLFGTGFRVRQLNTDYRLDDNSLVEIKKNRLIFDKINFIDTKYHTLGHLNGQIGFNQFSDWIFDLHIQGDRLLALDTPGSDEDLYYGRAFVKGNANITGDLNKIKIDARLQSQKGTIIHIPLRDVETVGEDDFIRFYRSSAYKNQQPGQKSKQNRYYEGLELNLDLDITRNAIINIVLDREFGSQLTAKGEGTMLMEITTAGKFNMWGTYQVVEGFYDFRYLGIIDKRFEVDAGSTLAWNGDPYHATLNIRAVYHIPAVDITPLLKDAVALQQKVPVDVVINLTGDLMKPRIDFQIEIPQANGIIRSQAEYVLSDPDKRMLQVLSLLYSGNFISEDILKLNSLAAAEGNLSERVLSVFNSLLQNEVFNVKLDYVPGRQNPQNNIKTDSQVGLTVQTKVNKRIFINGKVVMPVGRYTSSSVSGDLEAVLWLNPDGTWQLHVYNKRTPIEYAGQEEGYTQGIGFRFNTDFDTFRELAAKFGFKLQTSEELQN